MSCAPNRARLERRIEPKTVQRAVRLQRLPSFLLGHDIDGHGSTRKPLRTVLIGHLYRIDFGRLSVSEPPTKPTILTTTNKVMPVSYTVSLDTSRYISKLLV
ncbi:hypothetical protein H4Q26_014782 [Puccinia striiformis f. sp. tritici PST-130]|nr:hypothetical protein H4Q26_014782 [Puccinia striiformis f. sp. tritici PST-130]